MRNGVRLGIGDVTFPDLLSFAPTQVRVRIKRTARLRLPAFGGRRAAPLAVAAKATASIMPLAGAGAHPMVDALSADIHSFAAGAEATDDITVLALRWIGLPATA